MKIPNYIPGDKVKEFEGKIASLHGKTINYIPGKEEKKEEPRAKKPKE